MHLLLRRNAVVKPILLTYQRTESIDTFLADVIKAKKAFLEVYFDKERERHQFWELTEPEEIHTLRDLFDQHVPEAYIADGHHRSSTIALLHKQAAKSANMPAYEKFLCAFFPTSEVEIMEFNRIVEGLGELSNTQFMARLSKLVDIEEIEGPTKPSKAREFAMSINKEWYMLRWKGSVLKRYKDMDFLLDVHLLNQEILHNIIGIVDIRTDTRVKYVEGPVLLENFREMLLKKEYRIGFLLYPVQLNEFLQIADAGEVLPPKSTWFEPRMRNGLISQEY